MLSDPEPVAAPAHAEHAAHPSRSRISRRRSSTIFQKFPTCSHSHRKKNHEERRYTTQTRDTLVHVGTNESCPVSWELLRFFQRKQPLRPLPTLENSESCCLLCFETSAFTTSRSARRAPARVPRLPWLPAVNKNLSAPCLWRPPPRSALRCRPRASCAPSPPHAAAQSAAASEP